MELRWCHKNPNASTLFLAPYIGIFNAHNLNQSSSAIKALTDRGLIGTYLFDSQDQIKENWGNLYCVFKHDEDDYSDIKTYVDHYYDDDRKVVIFRIDKPIFDLFVAGEYSKLPISKYSAIYGDLDLYMEKDSLLTTLALRLIAKHPKIVDAFDREIGSKEPPSEYFPVFDREKETYYKQSYDFKAMEEILAGFDILK